MPIRLIRRDGQFPPGGFPYLDPKTGMKFPGLEANFKQQVGKIIAHRFVNGKKYPPEQQQYFDYDFVAEQLDEEQCRRLGNDPRWCHDTEKPNNRRAAAVPDGEAPNCHACGRLMVKRYCRTCGGQRAKGWKCPWCHMEIDT